MLNSPIGKGFLTVLLGTYEGFLAGMDAFVCHKHPGMIELLVAVEAYEMLTRKLETSTIRYLPDGILLQGFSFTRLWRRGYGQCSTQIDPVGLKQCLHMLRCFWPTTTSFTLRQHLNPAELCATLHLLTILFSLYYRLLTRQLQFPNGMTESIAGFRLDGHQLYVAQLLHATSFHNGHIVAGTPIASGFTVSIVKAASAALVLRPGDAFVAGGAAVPALVVAAETRCGTCCWRHIGRIA